MHCVRLRKRALTPVLIISKSYGNTVLGIKFLPLISIYSFPWKGFHSDECLACCRQDACAETRLVLLKLSSWLDFNQIWNVSTCFSERTSVQNE